MGISNRKVLVSADASSELVDVVFQLGEKLSKLIMDMCVPQQQRFDTEVSQTCA